MATPARGAPVRDRSGFVGSASCAACHRAQADAYKGSHHARALTVPVPEEVQARFDGRAFKTKLGGATKFSQEDGAPVVTTLDDDRKTVVLKVPYVSGVWPLQQYVVATERGKLQSLGVVWDTRAPAQSGVGSVEDARGLATGAGRQFHVYGAEGIAPDDALFFTAPAQNWNHMCADCHSTFLERRYDADADRFDTRWAELSVGCEACHGPGAEHVRSAKTDPSSRPVPFFVSLTQSDPWTRGANGSPQPHRQDGVEVEACAPCHSLREPLQERFLVSDPFLDSFAPELLRRGFYHADGQVQGEVYEWGSFLQSRMYQAGVRCSDCHEPHSGKLRAPDDALCVSCHEPARFAVETHTHHSGKDAPLCIDCHMPPDTFMQIDERRDHSIRVPRPDHSVLFGTPNACNGCHVKESVTWARDRAASWFPDLRKRKHFVDALGLEFQGAVDSPHALRGLALDPSMPSIARATALERLGRYPSAKTVETLSRALKHPDALVAYGAILGAAQWPLAERAPLLLPALRQRVRAGRIAAARALAGLPVTTLPATTRAALEEAFVEVEKSFAVSASRAESHVERSAFELARGRMAEAEAALRTALRIEPCLAEAYLNLAELERSRHDEEAALRAIRAALQCRPDNAGAHHALGLWQVRAGKQSAALGSLRNAVRFAPSDPRFSYVLAVALAGKGERDEAIGLLESAVQHDPNDQRVLEALARYLTDAHRKERAQEVLLRLRTLQD